MFAKDETQLTIFNTLAMRYQDEAYTLAYYLLGEDSRAAEATQAAFTHLYRRGKLRADGFRVEILRQILLDCRPAQRKFGGLRVNGPPSSDPQSRPILLLKEGERSAVVLVDVLGLEYAAAAQVLGCSIKQLGKLLALARLNLIRHGGC